MAQRRSRGKRRTGPSSPADAKRYVDEADDSDDDAVPIDHDSDDEEIDEDEAFGPEDEKKYGHYFQSKEKEDDDDNDDNDEDNDDDDDDDDEDDASGEDEDDDEDEGDGGAYMLSLLDKIAPPSDGGGKDDVDDGRARVASSESEHAAPGGGGLTLEALARGSTDERGFAGVRADALAATRPAVPAPRATVATARAERDVRFAAARDDVSRWVDAVRTHRDAACLDLRPTRAPAPTREALVDTFSAETELETRLSAALERATDATPDAVVAPDDDDDDLGRADLTIAQLKQRRGELSKMRALLFYEEQRRHHVNKIKSKKYRKIRRRKRERLAEAEVEARGGEDGNDNEDDDEAERLREKEDLDRARERMSLAHKNTSQWAKRQLRRGKALDKGTRQALSAQLRKGEDLKRKMMGDRDDDDDDEEKDDATLLREAKALLSVGNEDQKEEKTRKGLFGLSFMKKGIEAQRVKAKEEARQLLEELEADDDDESGDDDSHPEDEDKNDDEQPSAPPPDGAELVRPGTLVASGFGETHGLRVDGCVDVGTGAETNKTATASVSEHDATLTLPPLDPDAADDAKRTTDKTLTPTPRTTNEAALIEEADKDHGDNPWLDRAAKKRRRKRRDDDHDATDGPNLVADQHDDDDNEVVSAPPAVAEDDATKSKETQRPTSQLTQAELVKRAFAAPADAEDEFLAEKERVKEREDPNRKKKKDADDGRKKGWGSWTGDGVKAALPPPPPPPSSSRAKRRRRDGAAATHEAVLSPAVADEHRRRRGDDRLPHVIISERRVKAAANALQIGAVPWPYSTREQYENSLKGAVGPEWNVDPAFREAVRPKVRVAAGRIVRPLSRRAKTASALPRRGPAKF